MLRPDPYNLQDIERLASTVHSPVRPGDAITRQFHWHGPADVGALTFTKYQLPGVQISDVHGTVHRPLQQRVEGHPATTAFVFQFAGSNESIMEHRRRFRVEAGQDNLIYEPSDRVQHVLESSNGRFHRLCIAFEPDYFAELVRHNASWLPLYEKILPRQNPQVLFEAARPTAPQAQLLLAQLRACPYTGPLQRLYLEARLHDLFIAQQQHYLTLLAQASGAARRQERELAHAVRDYLDRHYAQVPTLQALARLFGTNDCSLKRGFRHEFGTTVFGYVADKRLAEAQLLLAHTQLPIDEVAARVGYAGAANFATAFKRRFGLTPSQVRGGRRAGA